MLVLLLLVSLQLAYKVRHFILNKEIFYPLIYGFLPLPAVIFPRIRLVFFGFAMWTKQHFHTFTLHLKA